MQKIIFKNRLIKSIIMMLLVIVSTFGYSQSIKGLYVDNFYDIIGNPVSEDKLLAYAKANEFNYLILYNTARINREKFSLDNNSGSLVWKHFINKAKSEYSIIKIGVVGEKSASFIPVIKYNQIVENNSLDRIDIFNLEFEFWNKRLCNPQGYYCTTYLTKEGFNCSTDGAFEFYMKQLKEIRNLISTSPVEIETYIGNPTNIQLSKIAKATDRLLIHYYLDKVDKIGYYKIDRLQVLQETNPRLKIAPIFSSRENHLGSWLKTHKIDELPTIFFNQLKSIPEIDLQSLNFEGVIWYRYTSMPKID